jgi:hypothetical protein
VMVVDLRRVASREQEIRTAVRNDIFLLIYYLPNLFRI